MMTPEQRSRAMSRVKTKDGPLEVVVRSALWKRGYRFRKHVKDLPGKPDIVFTKQKLAVFIDGDFWHGYDFDNWKHKLTEFWRNKIETNIARDERNFVALKELGWHHVRIWGNEIKKDVTKAVEKIITALEETQPLK